MSFCPILLTLVCALCLPLTSCLDSGFKCCESNETETRAESNSSNDQRMRLSSVNVDASGLSGHGIECRFASSLLEKLLQYLDIASMNLKLLKPSTNLSRRMSFKQSSRDVKFFSKVVLPLMEKYFSAQRTFFLTPVTTATAGFATMLSIKYLTFI